MRLSWCERQRHRFIVKLSAPRWISLNAICSCCLPSHSCMLLGSVVVIIAHKSTIAGWSSTGLRSACAGVVLFTVNEMVLWLWWLSDTCRRITALGPCELGLAADLVIIDPILGPTGQVCPSGVPHKPLRWGLVKVRTRNSSAMQTSTMQKITQSNVQTMQCVSLLSAFGSWDRTRF